MHSLELLTLLITVTGRSLCDELPFGDVDEFAFPTLDDISNNKRDLMASFNCDHSRKHAALVNKLGAFLAVDKYEDCTALDVYKEYMCSDLVHRYKFVVLDGRVRRPVILNLYRDAVVPVILNFSAGKGVCDDFYVTVNESDDLGKVADFILDLSKNPAKFLAFIKEKYENCERNLMMTKLCGIVN